MRDPWEGWEGDRTLWLTVGRNTMPLVLTTLALSPTVIVPICTQDSTSTLMTLKEFFIERDDIRWVDPIIVAPDDPTQVHRGIIEADLPPGHLAYAGGTTVMSAQVLLAWSQLHGGKPGARAWYLADRAGELRSQDLAVQVAGCAGVPSTINDLLRVRGVKWNVGVDHQTSMSATTTTDLDSCFPFGDEPLDDSGSALSVLAELLTAVVFGEDLSDMRTTIDSWNRAVSPTGLKIDDREPQNRKGKINLKEVARIRQGQASKILELGTYALLARLAGALIKQDDTGLPVQVAMGMEFSDGQQGVAEIDGCLVSGPRVLIVSCGIGPERSYLSNKRHEAIERAGQIGGSEARSLTVVLRSGQRRKRTRAGALDQIRRHREVLLVEEHAERDRHCFMSPWELLDINDEHTDPPVGVFQDLRSPLERMSGSPADSPQREFLNVVRAALYGRAK